MAGCSLLWRSVTVNQVSLSPKIRNVILNSASEHTIIKMMNQECTCCWNGGCLCPIRTRFWISFFCLFPLYWHRGQRSRKNYQNTWKRKHCAQLLTRSCRTSWIWSSKLNSFRHIRITGLGMVTFINDFYITIKVAEFVKSSKPRAN